MGRSTTAQLRDRDRHVTVSEHQTDAPLLPMAQIEKLNEIAPERVQWVFEETTKEGNFRRTETTRLNTLVFIERMAGIVSGLVIGSTALYTSYNLAMAGHDVVAGIIGGTTVVGLVSAFVIGVRRRTAPAK
ncbi:MAG: hypothetical protein U1E12_01345 [Hydrogenophaga sp.]|uniref:hypothetical protein n=1 Tax=Hydrogenophaga sp. TaxID=1904254 RepID=UPI002AB89054|nr:hypothetical protein [Hydrogenophaga sp.]MDZ4100302.1 hypothetical protein [Hydrogenophaga sp.]